MTELVTKHLIGHSPQGEIRFAQCDLFGGAQAPTDLISLEVTAEQYALVVPHVGTERFYIESGAIVEAPAQPTAYHDWDWTTKTWLPNVERAIATRKAQVEREAARRTLLPVSYAGSLFDADKVARERIPGTLNRLLRGDGLPSGWVGWRDYLNDMHWATDTPEVVQTQLAGLSAAIEDREQAIVIAGWTHKAAIEQKTSVEAVLEHDLTTGWPV